MLRIIGRHVGVSGDGLASAAVLNEQRLHSSIPASLGRSGLSICPSNSSGTSAPISYSLSTEYCLNSVDVIAGIYANIRFAHSGSLISET